MRLDVSVFGILACLTGLVIAQGDSHSESEDATAVGGTATVQDLSNAVIKVTPLPTYPIYTVGKEDHVIGYKNTTELSIVAISMKRYVDNVTIARGLAGDLSSSPSPTTTEIDSAQVTAVRRQGPEPFQFLMTNDSVTLPLKNNLYGNNLGKPLYFEFQWDNSTSKGSSYSPLIVVVAEDGSAAASSFLQRIGKEPNEPAYTEAISDLTSTTTTSSPVSGASTLPLTQASSDGGNKLSGGAIAGIAVGCAVAGVLIIGLLAWCLFFRRRGKHGSHAGANYTTDSGSGAIITDKKGAGIMELPPPAYPDDGGRLHDPRGSIVYHNDDNEYAPFSDRAASPLPPPGTAFATNSQTDLASTSGRPSTTRAPTPLCQSRYAHLIEEGMTEDEIRRLEEEERHLDAAIEDRGRGSGYIPATHRS